MNYRQCDWDEHLPLCEFAMNDMIQESIQQTPFFANYGWHPRSGGDFLSSLPTDTHLSGNSRLPWLERQREVLQMVRDSMICCPGAPVISMRTSTDKMFPFRSVKKSWFTEISCVMLFQEDNLQINFARSCLVLSRLCRSSPQTTLKLELPPDRRAHPVFNVSALTHYHQNEIPGRIQPPPPPVIDLDGHTRYIVDKILHHRHWYGRRPVSSQVAGYQRPTWEPEVNLKDESGQEIVQLKKLSQRDQLSCRHPSAFLCWLVLLA